MGEDTSELKNIIEAALLVAGQPLTLERLAQMFPEDSRPTREEIRAVLDQLEEEYAGRGIELKRIERAWRLQTREKYAAWLGRLVEERPARYSRATLETLAIIAYRQPVTRGDIEEIRGVTVSTEIIKTLLERDWIREVGRREVPGRPALYGTTRAFLEHFNLTRLEDLPPLAELRDLNEIGAELDRRAEAAGAGAGEPAGAEAGTAPAAGEEATPSDDEASSGDTGGDAGARDRTAPEDTQQARAHEAGTDAAEEPESTAAYAESSKSTE